MFEWAPSCALIMLIAVFKNLVTRYIFYCFFTSLEIFFLQLHLVLVALRLVEKYWCSICLSKKMILSFWQSFRKDFLKVKIQFSILVRVHYVLTYFSDNLLENNVKKFVRSFFVFLHYDVRLYRSTNWDLFWFLLLNIIFSCFTLRRGSKWLGCGVFDLSFKGKGWNAWMGEKGPNGTLFICISVLYFLYWILDSLAIESIILL